MITEEMFLEAKTIIDNYIYQQLIIIENYKEQIKEKKADFNLLERLPKRISVRLEEHNKYEPENNRLVLISDFIREIKKEIDSGKWIDHNKLGTFMCIYFIRGIGRLSHDEIMKYVRPYLDLDNLHE